MSGHDKGSVVAARYRLDRPLAQGGMGSLWVARHLQLDVDVAIKFMAPEFAAAAEPRARFEREAKAAAMLRSPHAVQIYDYGIEEDSPYIVMELLEGEDLSARLKREGRLSLSATRDLLEQVGKGLRRAHEVGLVHRDIKPANIFLSRQAGDETIKLVDFGIAKSTTALDGSQTLTGAVLGSPRYMSPEQVRSSAHVDHRTDLWSLAVIAFRCLTGQLPFPGGELGDIFVAICSDPIPRASDVAPDLGPEVDAFFERALMRPVDQRFQSVQALVDAFAALPGARDATPANLSVTAPSIAADPQTLATLAPGGMLASHPRRLAFITIASVATLVGLFAWLSLRDPAPPPPPAETATVVAPPPISTPPAVPATTPAPAPTPAPPTKAARRGTGKRTDDLLDHM